MGKFYHLSLAELISSAKDHNQYQHLSNVSKVKMKKISIINKTKMFWMSYQIEHLEKRLEKSLFKRFAVLQDLIKESKRLREKQVNNSRLQRNSLKHIIIHGVRRLSLSLLNRLDSQLHRFINGVGTREINFTKDLSLDIRQMPIHPKTPTKITLKKMNKQRIIFLCSI